MGYSLSVPCKSRQARDRLAEFLSGTMRPFSEVCGERADVREALEAWQEENKIEGRRTLFPIPDGVNRDYDPTQWICVGNELAYGAGSSKVGFNFSTQGDYGQWMYAVLKWAALHSGRKRGLNALSMVGMAHQRVPYITYDNEPTPVLLESMLIGWKDNAAEEARRRWVVNPLGIRAVEDFTHYMDRRYPSDRQPEGDQRKFLEGLYQRDKALGTIVEGEMRRLDVLWDDFIDMETR